ncbi:MAG: pantoate kinase, partial [Candidatus Thorarchaeota archaeon]
SLCIMIYVCVYTGFDIPWFSIYVTKTAEDLTELKSQVENMPYAAQAFVPGHVTGIFRIHDGANDPLLRGSVGAGFCISIGTKTTVRLADSAISKASVEYNGSPIEAPVTEMVIQRLLHQYKRVCEVEVAHESMLPIGVGFGASGAGALGASLALSALLDSNSTLQDAAAHAHYAEVVNHTGLGDVIAQTVGGVEVRIKPGAPGIGETIDVPFPEKLHVVLAGAPGLETRSILTNSTHRERIIKAGDELMKNLIETHTFSAFVSSSKKFAEAIDLMTPRIRKALENLGNAGLNDSSMVMLGDSVFCFCTASEIKDAVSILSEYWQESQIVKTSVYEDGGGLVK